MSKYDSERTAMGLRPVASSIPTSTSKYDEDRNYYKNIDVYNARGAAEMDESRQVNESRQPLIAPTLSFKDKTEHVLDKIIKDNPIMRVVNYPFAKAAEQSIPNGPLIGRKEDGSYGELPGTNARQSFIDENPIRSTGSPTLDKIGDFIGEAGSYFTPIGGGPMSGAQNVASDLVNRFAMSPIGKKTLPIIGNFGSSVANKLNVPLAQAGIQISPDLASKATQAAAKGSIDFGIANPLHTLQTDGDPTAKDLITSTTEGVLGGALLGGGLSAAGTGLKSLSQKYANTDIGDAFNRWIGRTPQVDTVAAPIERLALPPASRFESVKSRSEGTIIPTNESPIYGKGDIHTFELPDPTIPNILADIKQATYQQITPPLENPNELAKWIQSHLGIDNISLNEIRMLPYEDLSEMAGMIRDRLKPMEVAKKVANERGYDLNELMQGRAVTGKVDAPGNIISFDNPGFQKKPSKAAFNSSEFQVDDTIDYPFENVPLAPAAENRVPDVLREISANHTTKTDTINTQPLVEHADDVVEVSPEPRIRDRVDRYMDETISAARERLKAKRNTLSSNPIDQYADYAIIGASYIVKGTVKLADFTEQMVREFGDEIRPHIKDIFKKAKELYKHHEKQVELDAQGLSGIPIPMLRDIRRDQIAFNDLYRNFEHVFQDKLPQMKKSILDPFDDAKKANIVMQEDWLNKLKTEVLDKLGIEKGSKLSALVQKYGEKQIDLPALQAATDDWQKVVDADKWFRNAYNTILDSVNSTRAKIYPGNPEKIIPKRDDYYRHFVELQGFSGLKNIFDSPSMIDPKIEGISEFLTPKAKWASFMQRRGLGPFKNDAVGGFINYLPSASYASHIDPYIEVFKNLADNLADETGDTKNLNKFIQFLRVYSQDLGGKSNPFDRTVQEYALGRQSMAAINWLNSRVKANVVLGNAGSMLAQTANIPLGIAFAKQYAVGGAKAMMERIIKLQPNEPMKESGFLKERFVGSKFREFDTKWFEQPKKLAAWMLETGDRIGTEFIWNSVYQKGLAENVDNPIRYADNETRKLVAGRGIGEVPIIQKSKIFQLIAPFQLEVANYWKVMSRFVNDKEFASLATLLLGGYLMNKVAESTRGSKIIFDPVQAVIDATESGLSPLERGGRIAGEVFSNLPLGQNAATLLFPEHGNSVLPSREKLFGNNDPTRFGSGLLALGGVQDPLYKLLLPFGGSQLKKSLQGVDAISKDASYQQTFLDNPLDFGKTDNSNLRFPIDYNPLKAAQSLTFGPLSTSEARDYFDKDRRPLGIAQSQAVQNSDNPKETYSKVMMSREIDKVLREIDTIREDEDLSREQKLAKIRTLQDKLNEIQKNSPTQ